MRFRGKLAAITVAAITVAVGTLTGVPGQAWAGTDLPAVGSNVAVDGQPVTGYHDVLGRWVPSDRLDDAVVVVTPGTDDTKLYPRIDGIVGDRTTRIIQYPQSFAPFTSGESGALLPFLAPTYDTSRDIAVDHNLRVMRAYQGSDQTIVYTGFSQGSEALGNAVERAAAQGLLGPNATIVLVADPRGPWGVKPFAHGIPSADVVMSLLGIADDGARDPGASGDAKVVQVIVKGDPVANWQWDPRRPAESLLVNGAGFLTIHAGTGTYSYAHLENLEHEATYRSTDGNTTYEVYDTYHPVALLQHKAADAFGVKVDDATMRAWDRQAERFFPTNEVTPETAAPGVAMVRAATEDLDVEVS